MKKITKPAEREESVYYSDFSGKCFGNLHPPVELKMEFGYGSKYDGSSLVIHLDDNDMEDLLTLIKSKICEEKRIELKKMHNILEKKYDDNVQSRDWESCEITCDQIDLIKKLL